jgi:hypothetical protein
MGASFWGLSKNISRKEHRYAFKTTGEEMNASQVAEIDAM